ncbi:hypothetical protein DF185_01380 [Marinifilum breve]|uniref:HTH araC/xylS-type domain-containing protein n=1 Tax=Marinifilum breve TaxID=2184082 RepID=A0A2V4A281_9BACT|nr:AraC family transcriptional regulator [Marinifilum breve]PXY02772.1 hypothetical protein DF185_01380 [Marinifilum breve]
MEKRNKISDLDGIESLKVVNQKNDFPEHYHDTFCISLIENGMEAIKMGDNVIYTEKGHISINNPYEIHSNPKIEDSSENSFTTLYVSPDLVDSLLKKKKVNFQHQQFVQKKQLELFSAVIKNLEAKNSADLEKNLLNLLIGFDVQTKPVAEDANYSNEKWKNLTHWIDKHLEQKISLDFLARYMGMDKFSFAKEFRLKIGLSPINYVLMKKTFLAKKIITKDLNLTQLAYQLNFSDQAHFSRHFKRFIGVSPSDYKRQL